MADRIIPPSWRDITPTCKVPSTLGNGRPYNPAFMAGYYNASVRFHVLKAMAGLIPLEMVFDGKSGEY